LFFIFFHLSCSFTDFWSVVSWFDTTIFEDDTEMWLFFRRVFFFFRTEHQSSSHLVYNVQLFMYWQQHMFCGSSYASHADHMFSN
jgi:hypothetical protein